MYYNSFEMNKAINKRFELLEDIRSKNTPWNWPEFKKTLPYLETYSKELLHEIQNRFNAVVDYFTSLNNIEVIKKKYGITYTLLKHFANDLLNNINPLLILKKQFTYTSRFGLEIAQIVLRDFYDTNGFLPKAKDDGIVGISSTISHKTWIEDGISSWNDLLLRVFGKVNHRLDVHKGKEGLDRAKSILMKYYESNSKIPTANSTKEICSIFTAIQHKTWNQFGISSWNDLLLYVFGRINNIHSYYTGKKGLQRAREKLKNFYDLHNRLPKTIDKKFGSIALVCSQGRWKKYGISSWNDLLKDVFDKVNLQRYIYTGEEGLKNARIYLLQFHKKHKRLPTSEDKKMGSICGAINRKEWIDFGIKTWNDLLLDVFEEVNTLKHIHTGKNGLEKARKKLVKYYEKNQCLPKSSIPEFSIIAATANRGAWEKFNISSWNELLLDVFDKVNLLSPKFMGKDGLINAKKVLHQFYEKNQQLPKTSDYDMREIFNAINRKEWIDFGISSWNDLLLDVFGEVNRMTNTYLGKSGLIKARQKLRHFYHDNQRMPKSKEILGIRNAINRKRWKEFGINTWNDLLLDVFGKVNRKLPSKKYVGKKGLEIAKRTLNEFYNRNQRLPKRRDKGFSAIEYRILSKEWIKFGISSWNDLLLDTFGEVNQYKNIYVGKTGLQKARKKLQRYYEEYQKLPTVNDQGISGIYNSIRKKRWVDFGIFSWNDLLLDVFGRVNVC